MPYYEQLGQAHDDLLRCKDCQKLVTFSTLRKLGTCDGCGAKKFTEIRTLSVWEWIKIRLGIIRFDNRKMFLAEFSKAAQ